MKRFLIIFFLCMALSLIYMALHRFLMNRHDMVRHDKERV